MTDWLALLSEEVDRTSITAAAHRIGYSRTAVSLALAGKYPGKPDKLAATVLAALDTLVCPHLGLTVTPADCAAHSSGRAPTSSPGALRLWRACKGCPHKPDNKPERRAS